MKLNPAVKWHHVSLLDPKTWKIVATKQFGREGVDGRSDNGIQARLGRKDGKGPTHPVTLLFDPRLWTLEQGAAWVKKHGFKVREALRSSDQPDHNLSRRAKRLHEGRWTIEPKDLRKWLKKSGLGFKLTAKQALEMPELLKAMKRHHVSKPCQDVLSCSFFLTEDSKTLIVLPPLKEFLDHLTEHLGKFLAENKGSWNMLGSRIMTLIKIARARTQ